MRVRIVKPFAAYWNYEVRGFEVGEEFVGDLARHLADNSPAGSVEVLEGDPEPAVPGDPPAELDIDAKADAILAWVGDDSERAAAALAAEQAKGKPRSTLVKQLAKLADAGPEA
jgi:hypothetical protein